MPERKEKKILFAPILGLEPCGISFTSMNIYSYNKTLLSFPSLVTELGKRPIGSRREMRGVCETLNTCSQLVKMALSVLTKTELFSALNIYYPTEHLSSPGRTYLRTYKEIELKCTALSQLCVLLLFNNTCYIKSQEADVGVE